MPSYTKQHDRGEEFHATVPRSQPNEKAQHGHALGSKTSPNDNVDFYSVETYPPGTAPPEKTFEPNPQPGVLPRDEGFASGQDVPGATSQSVHKGLGVPASGMTSVEERHPHSGEGKRNKKTMQGSAQYGKQVEGEIRNTEKWSGKNMIQKDRPGEQTLTAEDRPSETA